MTRRFPIVSTIVVLLAVAAMIGLGFWQLQRLHEKEALLAQYAANIAQPYVPVQTLQPVGEDSLFRRASVDCPGVVGWRTAIGRMPNGAAGWRHIAICRLTEFGPGFAIDMGTSPETVPPAWAGGTVHGRLTWMPTRQPLILQMIGQGTPNRPMLVSEMPAPGLIASGQPDPSGIPNNHLSYAVQWFLFAAIALIIYGIALWRRRRPVAPPRRDG